MSNQFENIPGGSHRLNTGYNIPLVGFGTYKVVGESVLPAIDAALTAGYRLFDTAKYYKNEKEIGEALKVLLPKHNLTRSDIFITSKMFPTFPNTLEAAEHDFEESMRDLQIDYIDMYLVHFPKPTACENDDLKNPEYRKIVYQLLEKYNIAGRVRSIGISNYEIRHIEDLKTYAKIQPVVNQLEYHPHFARIELKKYCDDNNIYFQAYSSLARHEPALIEDPAVVQLAVKHNTTVQLILLAWALCQGVGIVPKSVTPSRIIDNFNVINIKLSKEEIESLRSLNKDQHYIRCHGWLVVH